MRLAQVFDTLNNYLPSKASLYLKRVGSNVNNYFHINNNVSLDVTNFSELSQGSAFVLLNDNDSSYTGNGFLDVNDPSNTQDWPVVKYPIKADETKGYFAHIRTKPQNGNITIKMFIDGVLVDDIDISSVGSSWRWDTLEFALPDRQVHTLEFSLEETGIFFDKIYISDDNNPPSGTGPDFDTAPFATIHLQLYEVADDDRPSSRLSVYDHKTTLKEVIIDDWYNFSLKGWDNTIPQRDAYALVLSASGTSSSNYIVWDLVDNDEYQLLPSAIKV